MKGRPKQPLELDRRFWTGIRVGLLVEDAAVAWGLVHASGVHPRFRPRAA